MLLIHTYLCNIITQTVFQNVPYIFNRLQKNREIVPQNIGSYCKLKFCSTILWKILQ